MTKLFLVSRRFPAGYDQYDSFVCTAESEDHARNTHPDGGSIKFCADGRQRTWWYDWVKEAGDVDVRHIGEYIPSDRDTDSPIICASFNAG